MKPCINYSSVNYLNANQIGAGFYQNSRRLYGVKKIRNHFLPFDWSRSVLCGILEGVTALMTYGRHSDRGPEEMHLSLQEEDEVAKYLPWLRALRHLLLPGGCKFYLQVFIIC